ncbi:MAG: DHH family phosphoesterase [Lachnospiraceae bacterium]|nr:DHH family phosphoesterase [Lachnospiraceae bacterium]
MLDIERNNSHTLTELIDLLKGKTVYVQTHNFPDPDAIGAGYGLQQLLIRQGIDAVLCYHGKIDRLNTRKMVELLGISIFSKEELEGRMGEDDPIICVDSQKMGGNILDLIGDEVACVDHHPTTVPVDYYYKDVRTVGSCATLISEYYDMLGLTPDAMTATALMYGLQVDTGGFTRGVTEEDVHAFGMLHPLADTKILSRLEQNQLVFEDLHAYGAAISNISIYDRIGVAFIPFACQDALIAITCDFILSLEEVDIAVVYSKRDDGYKFSIRAEFFLKEVDCGKMIAEALDGIGSGGGHAYMAGGFVPLEGIQKLGANPDEALVERFLHSLNKAVGLKS